MGSGRIAVYVESGAKRTIISAVDWPGWCRGARDDGSAFEAFTSHAPRYAKVVERTGLKFLLPGSERDLEVVERLKGDSGTDYGVPTIISKADREPVDEPALARSLTLLDACWAALDKAVASAAGHDLRKGPRGGGRELDEIIRHVLESNTGYLRSLGPRISFDGAADLRHEQKRVRQAVDEGLTSAVRDGMPAFGPRGGARWPPRYFVRRVAYHLLDHVWEIEDRVL